MKKYVILMLISAWVSSCAQESPKVKQVRQKPKTDLKNVKVVNAQDPVCHMKTAEYLKDTAEYKRKNYGFCSVSCKKDFKTNPAKYVKN